MTNMYYSLGTMICGNCEKHRHYECIDCQNDHKTELCNCDCHVDSEMHKHEK